MAFFKRNQLTKSDGFILPLTLTSLLILSMICFMSLDRLQLNRTGLGEEKQITESFLAFQSAKNELIDQINTNPMILSTGNLTESNRIVDYTFQSLSQNQLQVTLRQKTQTGSTLVSWFVYNKDTKKMEKWVTQ